MIGRLTLILAIACSGLGMATMVLAADPIQFTPEINIPNVFSGKQTVDDDFAGKYVRAVYIYFIWIIGILSTVMVIYGGIRWVAAAGNPGRISDARETVNNAIIGLIIALTSYTLLFTIDPNLTRLNLKVSAVNKAPAVIDPTTGCISNLTCPSGFGREDGQFCSGAAFASGVISGSFLYVGKNDNYCDQNIAKGICCRKNTETTICAGVAAKTGEVKVGLCSTQAVATEEITGSCQDQTGCGNKATTADGKTCMGYWCGADNVCFVPGKNAPGASPTCIRPASAQDHVLTFTYPKLQQCGDVRPQATYSSDIDCGQTSLLVTDTGTVQAFGTKNTCPEGQYCHLNQPSDQCTIVQRGTYCAPFSQTP